MNKVFFVEQPRNNVSLQTAVEFGDFVFIFGDKDRRVSIFRCTEFGQDVLTKLKELHFDFEKDYFCMTGGLVPVSLSLAVILKAYATVNVLIFNATANRYIERRIDSEPWRKDNGQSTVFQDLGNTTKSSRRNV